MKTGGRMRRRRSKSTGRGPAARLLFQSTDTFSIWLCGDLLSGHRTSSHLRHLFCRVSGGTAWPLPVAEAKRAHRRDASCPKLNLSDASFQQIKFEGDRDNNPPAVRLQSRIELLKASGSEESQRAWEKTQGLRFRLVNTGSGRPSFPFFVR